MPTTKLKNGQLPDTISSKTVDNTNTINTTTTNLKITGGTNGQVLQTDGSGNLSWTTAGAGAGAPYQVITKANTETVLNSATLQDDDELKITGLPAGAYNFQFRLLIARSNNTATVGLRIAIRHNGAFGQIGGAYWKFPSTVGIGTLADGTTTQDFTTGINYNNAYNSICIIEGAGVEWGGSATQDIILKWCQTTANANTGTNIVRGSQLILWKVR